MGILSALTGGAIDAGATAGKMAGTAVTGGVGEIAKAGAGIVSAFMKAVDPEDTAGFNASVQSAAQGAINLGVKVADMGIDGVINTGTGMAKAIANNIAMG